MGVKLDVSVESPLADDDRDILASICVMVLAIADRHSLADEEIDLARSCRAQHPYGPDLCRDTAVGHDGEHPCDELGDLDSLAPPPSWSVN